MIVSIFLLSTSIVFAQDSTELNSTIDSDTALELDLTELNTTNDLNENEQIVNDAYTFRDLQSQIDNTEDNDSITINGTYKYDKDMDESNP